MWGTAFPFIKVGYSAFKIEESDIGSKLILQECGLCWRDLWCFSFCGYQKENRRRFQKRYTARLFTRSGADRIAVYFYIHRNRFYKRNEHLYNNSLCVVLYRTFRAVVFQKRQTHADENYRLYSRIRRNYRNQFRRNCQHGHLVRRYDDSLFNNICGGRQHRCEKVTTGRDPFPVTAFQLLTGGFILLVSGICCGGSIGLINVESVSVLLWLAFVSAAAFSLWTALLKFHDASRISVFNLLVPVFGTVLSGLMLGENVFRIETLISLILISLGIAFVNMNLKNREVKYES